VVGVQGVTATVLDEMPENQGIAQRSKLGEHGQTVQQRAALTVLPRSRRGSPSCLALAPMSEVAMERAEAA
jgi:hypothetical protein